MDILKKIAVEKLIEIEQRKFSTPIAELKKRPLFNAQRNSLAKNLASAEIGVIAEFKRRSPSKGWINQDANLAKIIRGYEKAGASGISVLTDEKFFGGSLKDLEEAFENTNLPLLRKDFVLDEYQIIEAKAFGASAILLIAAILSEEEILRLANFAKHLELDVLLEITQADETPKDLQAIDIIGVNNRNLRDFTVNLESSFNLAKLLPEEKLKISESGLSNSDDVKNLAKAGFKGFLIGETFMKTENPAEKCAEFIASIS